MLLYYCRPICGPKISVSKSKIRDYCRYFIMYWKLLMFRYYRKNFVPIFTTALAFLLACCFSDITLPFFLSNLSFLHSLSTASLQKHLSSTKREINNKNICQTPCVCLSEGKRDHGTILISHHHDTDIKLFREIIMKAKLLCDNNSGNTHLPLKLLF